METFARLSVGSLVRVEGDLHSPQLDLKIDGNARVAHARLLADGRYRAGLQLLDVAYERGASA